MGICCSQSRLTRTHIRSELTSLIGRVLSFCNDKANAAKLRLVSRQFKQIIDERITYTVTIEVKPMEHICTDVKFYRFTVEPSVFAEKCPPQTFLRSAAQLVVLLPDDPLTLIKNCSTLNLIVSADASEDYGRLISEIALFFAQRRANCDISRVQHFTLELKKPPNDFSSDLIFTHLRSFSNLLPSGMSSISLHLHTTLLDATEYVKFLLGLQPNEFNYYCDRPDVDALLNFMRYNAKTDLNITPTSAGKITKMQGDAFGAFQLLNERWRKSTFYHPNKVTLKFIIPERAVRTTNKTCYNSVSEQSHHIGNVFVTFKHRISSHPLSPCLVGDLFLHMGIENDSTESTDCLGHVPYQLDYSDDDEDDEAMIEIPIEAEEEDELDVEISPPPPATPHSTMAFNDPRDHHPSEAVRFSSKATDSHF